MPMARKGLQEFLFRTKNKVVKEKKMLTWVAWYAKFIPPPPLYRTLFSNQLAISLFSHPRLSLVFLLTAPPSLSSSIGFWVPFFSIQRRKYEDRNIPPA
jgi:hypothetical protein